MSDARQHPTLSHPHETAPDPATPYLPSTADTHLGSPSKPPKIEAIMLTSARPIAAALLLIGLLAGCVPTGSESVTAISENIPSYPLPGEYPGIRVLEDLPYGSDDSSMRVDVCLPDEETDATIGTRDAMTLAPRAAVLSVHGGSWRQGDKAIPVWRAICQWLASEGFVAVSVNYRLAPAHPYPAGIDDVRQVVRWLRDDAQVERFALDPTRIGAFGGSAGANLVTQLGLEGEGDLSTGTRVASVVNLSGPIDLTTAGFKLGGVSQAFRQTQLDYLGCATYTDCPQARDASPLYDVDPSDPPFFVGHSTKELIPLQQSDALVTRLRDAGIAVTYITPDGRRHAEAMLDDDIRSRIADYLRVTLGE